ncbi:MAG: hypothetical protein EOP00_23005 [Pedobacter sp.]|nr:MAG: hypothetical protein EOP00_23005 [Pedobacter sp.]
MPLFCLIRDHKLFSKIYILRWFAGIRFHTASVYKLVIIAFFTTLATISSAQQLTKGEIDSLIVESIKIINIDENNRLNEKIKEESRKSGYIVGEVSAEVNIATNYYNQGRYDVALERIINIETLALSTNHYAKITNLLALKANCYGRLKFFDKSNRCLNEAMVYALKIKENDRKHVNVAKIYKLIGANITDLKATPDYADSALHYHKKSYNAFTKVSSHQMKAGIIIQAYAIGNFFLEKKLFDSAKHYYNEAVVFSEEFKQPRFLAEPRLGLATIQLKENNFKGALENYKEALAISKETKNLNNIKKSYQGLAIVYEKLGDESKSLAYSKKHGVMADSLAQTAVSVVSSSADLIVKENEKVYAQKSLRYFWLIATAIAATLLLAFSFITLRKRKNKLLQLKEDEQKTLNEKIQLLESDQLNETELAEIIRLAKNNDSAFFANFKKNHPLFIQKLMLKAPSLLGSDLILCAQLRLGFYTKDIARYTHATVRAVEGKKYRLRKKLNLHTDEDIYSWILNL